MKDVDTVIELLDRLAEADAELTSVEGQQKVLAERATELGLRISADNRQLLELLERKDLVSTGNYGARDRLAGFLFAMRNHVIEQQANLHRREGR